MWCTDRIDHVAKANPRPEWSGIGPAPQPTFFIDADVENTKQMVETPPTRRQILRAVGAAGLAGAFAGCEAPTSNQTTTDWVLSCDTSVVEPTVSGGQFTLYHGRQQEGARLLEGTKSVFEQRYESTVRIERAPYSPLQHLRTVIPEGDGPHLFTHGHGIAGVFVDDGLLSNQGENLRVEECVCTATPPGTPSTIRARRWTTP